MQLLYMSFKATSVKFWVAPSILTFGILYISSLSHQNGCNFQHWDGLWLLRLKIPWIVALEKFSEVPHPERRFVL